MSMHRRKLSKGDVVKFSAHFTRIDLTPNRMVLGQKGAIRYLIGDPHLNANEDLMVTLLTNGYHKISVSGDVASCQVGARQESEKINGNPVCIDNLPMSNIVAQKVEDRNKEYISVNIQEDGSASLTTGKVTITGPMVEEALKKKLEGQRVKRYCPHCGNLINDNR